MPMLDMLRGRLAPSATSPRGLLPLLCPHNLAPQFKSLQTKINLTPLFCLFVREVPPVFFSLLPSSLNSPSPNLALKESKQWGAATYEAWCAA